MGIYKLGNNTYPRHIRHRSNLGHIFQEKNASYGLGNMVYTNPPHAQHELPHLYDAFAMKI